MAEALGLPNVEAQTIVHLAPLVGVDVMRVMADPLPSGPFVRVVLTSTRRINLTLLERGVTLECWGGTDAQAAELSSVVYAHMGAWHTDHTWVPVGEDAFAGGPYADVDPDTKRPRYIMTANVRQAVQHL